MPASCSKPEIASNLESVLSYSSETSQIYPIPIFG